MSEREAKGPNGERWLSASVDGMLGRWLDTFRGPKGITTSLQICADAGDPNIVRLPTLAGSRIIFDISAESGIRSMTKMAPYEAQYMARAHESGAYLVQSNFGAVLGTEKALDPQGGSHGNSLVVDPSGNVLVRAPTFGEHLVLQDLDMRLTTGRGKYTPHEFMRGWYAQGEALLSLMPID